MSDQPQSVVRRPGAFSAWRNPRRKRFWLLPAILVYTLVGFVLVPWIVRTQVVPGVSADIGYPIELDEVDFNPFVIGLEARGFRLIEADGAPLFSFDRLYVNLQLSSLVRRAWWLREVELDGFVADLRRDADGTTNIGRFMADLSAPPAAAQPDAAETGAELPRLKIGRLAIRNGQADLADFVPQPEVTSRLQPVDVTINDLSTLPADTAQQDVLIRIGDHGRLNWRGSLQLNPLLAEGRLEISGRYLPIIYRYVENLVAFELSEGRAEAEFDYRVALNEDGQLRAEIDHLDFVLRGIVLTTENPAREFLQLPEITLTNGRFRWPEQVVAFDGLDVGGAWLHVIREPDGLLNLQKLVLPADEQPELPVDQPVAVHPLQDWTINLGELSIDDFGILFEDQTLARSTAETRFRVDASVRELSNRLEARFPLTAKISPEAGGTLALEGRAGFLPVPVVDARLRVDALALAVAQPWIAETARIEIDSGSLNAELKLAVSADEPLAVSGGLNVAALDVSDVSKDQRLIGWQALAIDKFRASLAESLLDISRITVAEPYVRILIDTDQSTNFTQLLVESDSNTNEPEPDVNPETGPLAFMVGQVRVDDGRMDFTDLALPLPFSARINELGGEVSTLSTVSTEPAVLSFEGGVDDYGLATISGRLLPSAPKQLTDIELNFRNIDMPDLSPYTIKFAGRSIEDGSLDVNLKYLVENSELAGDNQVLIRDLKLGDKVDQPGATNLPLSLAVELLKKPDGSIDIELPVSGNVDDPDFSVGGLVFRAFVNLVTKAATSPFRLLGGIVGDDTEGLDEIDFRPGQSELKPPEREKLATLSAALAKRPGLALLLSGAVEPDADAQAIRSARVDTAVTARLETDEQDAGDEALLTRRTRRVLEKLVRERLPELDLAVVRAESQRPVDPGQPDGGQVLDEPAYIANLRARLIATEPLPDSDLAALARSRAQVIDAALRAGDGLADDRVQISDEWQTVTLTEAGRVPDEARTRRARDRSRALKRRNRSLSP